MDANKKKNFSKKKNNVRPAYASKGIFGPKDAHNKLMYFFLLFTFAYGAQKVITLQPLLRAFMKPFGYLLYYFFIEVSEGPVNKLGQVIENQ